MISKLFVVAAVTALVSGQKNDIKIVCGCSCYCVSEWSEK